MNCLLQATPAAIGKAYLLSGLLSDFSGNATAASLARRISVDYPQ